MKDFFKIFQMNREIFFHQYIDKLRKNLKKSSHIFLLRILYDPICVGNFYKAFKKDMPLLEACIFIIDNWIINNLQIYYKYRNTLVIALMSLHSQ
jgi:hypothetical protein